MESSKERTTAGRPCVFCNSFGRDMRITCEDGTIVHWCHKDSVRNSVSKGDIVQGNDGKSYICISENKMIEHNGLGEYHLFKEYLSKEEYRKRKMQPFSKVERDPDALIKGECKRLSHEEMDERMRFFLSLLILEEKDRLTFEKEWKLENGMNEMHLIEDYPIRSLPLPDKTRFAYQVRTNNPTRKQVVKAMFEKFGDLRGIPGFYRRGGKYYEGKPEWERWTFGGDGILFPCYDADGYLYAVRLKDRYPVKEVKEGKSEPFRELYGSFVHSYDETGYHQWKFYPSDGSEAFLVTSGNRTIVELGDDWCPKMGKVANKYKNFSSFLEKRRGENGEVYNCLDQGTRSGSPYSVYSAHTLPERKKYVIITEGEKKGMIANSIMGMTTIVVPGVWSYRSLFQREDKLSTMELLRERGVNTAIVCYDADKLTNEEVKKAEAALVNDLKNFGFGTLIGDWSNKYEKGLDDLLMQGIVFNLCQA